MKTILVNLIFSCGFAVAQTSTIEKGTEMVFPPAKKIPHLLEIHGDKRVDNYFWMRERDTKPVLDFLKLENKRTAIVLKPVAKLEKTLFSEMKKRIKEDDSSVPIFDGGYYYYTRMVKGGEYPIHCRKKGSLKAREKVILDENTLAKGKSYFEVGDFEVSPNGEIGAYSVDVVGRRIYTIKFIDLKTGKHLKDKIEAVTPSIVWAPDNKTIYYVKQDPETLRAFQVFRYELASSQPELVFEEKDTTYNVGIGDSKTKNFLFMASEKRDSSEWRVLDTRNPAKGWEVFAPRELKHEYSVEDAGDRFYVLTNWNAKNFRVMEAPYTARDKKQWKEIIPHDPKVLFEGLDAYATHLVVSERQNGLASLRVVDRQTGKQRYVQFSDESYEMDLAPLPEYESKQLRFKYQSMVQPPAVYEEDFDGKNRVMRKEREVPTYDKSKYEVKRIWASAKDGVKVPITVLKPKSAKLDGKNPALIYGYGSYGVNNDASFWGSVFSLVDRGFIVAMTHIRGGSEMGRDWYETGRLKFKMNTFNDFIAATEKLIADGYTAKDRTHIMGGSAGGLLVGAVMNMRPDLFKSVCAQVPFVDVLTTMLDETLPLTTGEYNEWGDPRIKDEFMYMRQYSPYDNVEAKNYPNVFVSTGYHDSQVQYWEPAKWVAKLREMKTDKNILILHTELEAGHGGASGRFEHLKTLAKQLAFILMVEGIKE